METQLDRIEKMLLELTGKDSRKGEPHNDDKGSGGKKKK